MDDLEAKFRVRVDGKDELENFFSGGERGAKSMQSAVKAALADTAKSVAGFASGLAKDLMHMSGLKLGLAANAKQALEFRDALEQLAVSAGVGDDQIAGLKKQILDTASASNQFKDDVTGALQAFVEKTGDLKTARDNLALYAQTATATRAAISDVAEVGVQLSDKLNVKDQAASFAILATQAKKGAIELKDLATYAPRIFSSGAAAGLTGEKGVREAGALAQVYAKAFGGRGAGASVATAIENTFRDIAKKAPAIEEGGIKVAGRDPVDVLFDIIRRTKGDSLALARTKIFDARSMRGVNILANEYKATGGFGTYESFRDVQPQAGIIAADAARQTSTGLAALKRSQIEIERKSEENLGDSADFLAKHSGIISKAYGMATEHPLIAAGLGASALGGVNVLRRVVPGLIGFGGGGGGLGGGGVAGLLGKAGVTPVAVTNWPASMGGPAGLVPPGGTAGKLGVGSIIPVVGAALTGWELGKQLDEGGHLSDAIADVGQFATGGKKNLDKQRQGQVKSGWRLALASMWGGADAVNAQAKQEVKNNIKIEIHGDVATITEDGGTRSSVNLERRNGGDQ